MFLLPGCFTNVYLTKVCYAEKEVNVCWCLLVACVFNCFQLVHSLKDWFNVKDGDPNWPAILGIDSLTRDYSQIARGKTKTRRTRSSGWSRVERLATWEEIFWPVSNFNLELQAPQKAQFRRCWFAADHSHLATWSGRTKRTKTRRKGSVIREYLARSC